MDILIESLKEEVKNFDFKQFPNTNVISVYRKRDLTKVKALLYVLCYKFAIHEVSGNHFEVLFNA